MLISNTRTHIILLARRILRPFSSRRMWAWVYVSTNRHALDRSQSRVDPPIRERIYPLCWSFHIFHLFRKTEAAVTLPLFYSSLISRICSNQCNGNIYRPVGRYAKGFFIEQIHISFFLRTLNTYVFNLYFFVCALSCEIPIISGILSFTQATSPSFVSDH